jgi:5,10-methylenetetrahydromethanopterin reductase
MHGRHVHLDDVQLDQPPPSPPPVLAGVRGPKSLAMAGRAAGGMVLAETASSSYVRLALSHAGHPANFHVAVFAVLGVDADRRSAYVHMAPWLAGLLDAPTAGLHAVPFFDDLVARYRSGGLESLATMPSDWWTELGPIGTLDDAQTHIESLEAAGAHSIGLFPTPRRHPRHSPTPDHPEPRRPLSVTSGPTFGRDATPLG